MKAEEIRKYAARALEDGFTDYDTFRMLAEIAAQLAEMNEREKSK